MQKFFLLISLLFLVNISIAQRGIVTGNIKDVTQNTPLPYAGVMLMQTTDSALVKGGMSDKEGNFELVTIANGSYFLKISLIGYEDWYSDIFTISSTHHKVNFNDISLRVAVAALHAAEITFKKPLFEEKQGKMIMNVEAQPSAAGDNVIELLRKMPSVMVDQNDNISILGKSGVMILIDDKQTYLSGDDLINLLKTMPASSIDKIEVIKNPSARFDAAGTGGIINLVTKKDKNRGINGSVSASGGYSGSFQHNEGVNITARLQKVVLSGSYYHYNFRNKSSDRSEKISTFNDVTTRMLTNEKQNELWNSSSLWKTHGFSFGTDYYIDKKNTIGISYRGSLGGGNWKSLSNIRLYTDILPDSAYQRNSNTLFKMDNHTVNVDYKHEFDTIGKVLFVNLTYALSENHNNTNNVLNFFEGDLHTLLRKHIQQSIAGPNTMQVVSAKVDYEHRIEDAISFEMGIKSSYVFNQNKSNNYVDSLLLENQSNQYSYKENINAGYVLCHLSPSQMIDIQAGLRAEHVIIEGLLLTTQEKNRQQYIDLFPSFEVSYRFPKLHQLGFSYRSRIQRPDYHVLNPYISISDQYNISTGNPHLKPEYSHHFEVSYSWMYMIFTSLNYRFSKGEYTDVQYTDLASLLRLTRPENIGKSNLVGGSIYARIPIKNWWVMSYSLNGNIGKTIFDYGNQQVSKRIFSSHFYTSQLFTFLKNYSIELSAWGMPSSENVFGRTKGLVSVNAAVKADFFQRSFTVKLSINDIFNNGKWVSDMIYPDGSISHSEWLWESRRVWLNLSYRFGKSDLKLRHKRHITDEELKRMEGQKQQDGTGGIQP